MWGRAGQALLRNGGCRLRAAAPISSGAAAAALRPCCCSSLLSSPPSPSSPPPSDVLPPAVTAAGFAPQADVVVGDGVAVVEPPPPSVQADPTLLQPRVIIYDGVCHLCHAGVKWVIKADKYKKIKFCCLQSKAAEPYLRLCGLDREDVLQRFLFVEGLYSYYQGSTAALRAASYLPLPYSALGLLLVVPPPLRDLVYDYVAKRRYDWFGKDEKCIIAQDKELLDRFIDRDELLSSDNNESS